MFNIYFYKESNMYITLQIRNVRENSAVYIHDTFIVVSRVLSLSSYHFCLCIEILPI